MTRTLLNLLAFSVNPVLLFVFVACVVGKLNSRDKRVQFLVRSAAALLITFPLAHINRWMHLWKHHFNFPSGHMTFYISVAVSFFLLDRRSRLFTVPFALFYGWLIVFLGYHAWLDLSGAVVLAVPVTLLCHSKSLQRETLE